MNAIVDFLTGRRTKWVTVVVWLAVAAGLAPLGAKFEGAQRNEPSSFLPGSAESLEVLEAEREFPGGQATPAVVVYRNADGLTEAQQATIETTREEISASLPEGAQEPTPVTISEDGTTAIYAVPIVAGGDEEILTGAVDDLRAAVGSDEVEEGLVVKVSGPAGLSTDASKAFEGINTTLLFATAAIVIVLLVLIFRSPIFWLLPVLAILFAEVVFRGLGYLLASNGIVVNGQTAGITLVLVFGAGTDYALLLTARYREELRRSEDKYQAMRVALRRAGPTLVASAATTISALLVLTLAEVNGTAGLGPVAAIGLAVVLLSILTLLPALLLVGGRRAFWPFVPRVGEEGGEVRGFWRRVGERVAIRPRRIWIGTSIALAVCCLGLVTLDDDLTSANGFRGTVESVEGQELIAASFPAGANAPATVLVRDPARVDAVRAALEQTPEVASLGEVELGPPGAVFTATLTVDPFSEAGYEQIAPLRELVRTAGGSDVLVGGPTAEERDLRASAERDTYLLIPLILLVVFAILVLLLRALVAPVVLVLTTILSFFSALGLSVLIFEYAFDFPGEDPSLPLYAFVFLVALGVDYNVFLMARAREESARHGTREGMLRALAVTGGVITSAGVVLAGTFAVLAVLPIVVLTQIGFLVALGVLLDTLIVRSILVPALTFELGDRIWVPSALARRLRGSPPQPATSRPSA